MDMIGQAEPGEAIPQPFGTVRIMIPRQQVPVDVGEQLHALDGCAQRNGVGGLAVVDVARDEHVRGAMGSRELAQPLDGAKPSLPKGFLLNAELLEDLADLPIRGVNEPHKTPLRRALHRVRIRQK
jgi:hypothetical protein